MQWLRFIISPKAQHLQQDREVVGGALGQQNLPEIPVAGIQEFGGIKHLML
jgi:hypothetical protein